MKFAIAAFTLFSLAFQVLAQTHPREDHLDNLEPGSKRLKTGNHKNVLVAVIPTNFARCDIKLQRKAKTAVERATGRIKRVNKSLAASFPQDSKRYKKWLGAFSKERYSTVKSRFQWMEQPGPQIIYDCDSCTTLLRLGTSPPLAYKREDGKFKIINFCPEFWKRPVFGSTPSPSPSSPRSASQSEIIIGLISMFNTTTTENDIEFPVTDIRKEAKWLAEMFPDEAVLNEINHAIFAETD